MGALFVGISMCRFCVAAAMGVAWFSPAFAQNYNTYAVGGLTNPLILDEPESAGESMASA